MLQCNDKKAVIRSQQSISRNRVAPLAPVAIRVVFLQGERRNFMPDLKSSGRLLTIVLWSSTCLPLYGGIRSR